MTQPIITPVTRGVARGACAICSRPAKKCIRNYVHGHNQPECPFGNIPTVCQRHLLRSGILGTLLIVGNLCHSVYCANSSMTCTEILCTCQFICDPHTASGVDRYYEEHARCVKVTPAELQRRGKGKWGSVGLSRLCVCVW